MFVFKNHFWEGHVTDDELLARSRIATSEEMGVAVVHDLLGGLAVVVVGVFMACQ